MRVTLHSSKMNIIEFYSLLLTSLLELIFYFKDFFIYKLFERKKIPSNSREENIDGKVVVVTGGSLGMGKASAKEFAKRGAIVVIGDVDLRNGQITVEEIQKETGNMNVTLLKLDLSDLDSVEEFAKQVSIEHPKIKILLNNAGICPPKVKKSSKDGFDIVVAVNYMGHFLLTNLLKKNLKAETKARVVSMASTIQLMSKLDLEDLNMEKSGLGFDNSLPYANSKFCISLFTKEFGKRVSGTEIHTYALCPGLVNSSIHDALPKLSKFFMQVLMGVWSVNPDQAASEFILHCALDKNIENETGKTYRMRKQLNAVNKRLDDELARRLWEKSSQLVKLQERLKGMK